MDRLLENPIIQVQNPAVKFQEGNGNNVNILHEYKRVKKETKDVFSIIPKNSDPVPKAQHMQSNSKSQKHFGNNDELGSMYNIDQCKVAINHYIPEHRSVARIQGINLENRFEPAVREYEDSNSISNEEEHTDVDSNSGSDWEKEYLGELLKSRIRDKLKKGIKNKTEYFNRNMNLTNHMIWKPNKPCGMRSEFSSKVRNNFYRTSSAEKDTKNIKMSRTNSRSKFSITSVISSVSVSKHNTSTSRASSSHKHSNDCLPSQNKIAKYVHKKKTTNNTNLIESNSEKYSFQCQDSVKTTTKNKRSLHFILQKNIAGNIDSQQNSNHKIQAQTTTSTNVKPVDPYKIENKIKKSVGLPSQVESKLNNNNISLHVAQNTRNKINKMIPGKSLLYPRTTPSGSLIAIADTISLAIPPSHGEETTLGDKFDGDDDLNLKVQAQTVTFSKPANTYENEKNTVKNISFYKKESNLNHNVTSHKAQDNGIDVKRTMLKPCTVPTGLHVEGTVETFSPTTPSSHEEGSILDDNFDDNDDDDESFSEIEPLLPHQTYCCNKCNTFFYSLNKFRRHRYSSCNGYKREARHQCSICDKRFNGIEKKEAHQNSHTNARPFKCFDCDRCFNSKVARQMHHKNIHLNKKTRYLCCFCGYICPSPGHLLAHEEEHRLPEGSEAAKPFKCLVCGKGFISLWKLQNHKKEHQLKKCSKCSEQFKTNSQLRNHMEVVHSIIKTYDCKECGKQFKNPKTLRNHRTTHSSMLLFSCDICDKGFKRKTNLRQHMISHSDERPISCPECGETFKRITHLKQHTAAFHGDGRK